MSNEFCIKYSTLEVIKDIAHRNHIGVYEAVNWCALIGSDFLTSTYWAELIDEYYKETNSFNWLSFLDWSANKMKH